MHIYTPHTHAEFAEELPLHQPLGLMHKIEEREILICNSVTKQGFLSICADMALQIHTPWDIRAKQEKLLTSYNYVDFLVLECARILEEKSALKMLFSSLLITIPDSVQCSSFELYRLHFVACLVGW